MRLQVPETLRAIAALVMLVALAACRSSQPPAPATTTLVVAQGGDPGALNPAVTTSGNTHPVTDQIFNGLVGLDAELNPVPELAERWQIEDDGRTYRFTLRDGVRWHDGTPFTSADVKFTFDNALLKYHSRTRAGLEGLLLGIDTPDNRTAVFRLKRPYSPLLQRLDVVEASIIPRHQYEGQDLLSGEPTRRPIGTGPFRFVSYAPGNNLVSSETRTIFGRVCLAWIDWSSGSSRTRRCRWPRSRKEKWTTSAAFQELMRIDCARLRASPWSLEPAAQGDRCVRTC